MPLVQHNNLPSIERIGAEGVEVCLPNSIDRGLPSIRVGFLNMMPDQAIAATERQFLRLLSVHKNINCWFYPFTINGIDRSEDAKSHIQQYYVEFDAIREIDLDALVITGANVTQPLLMSEPFWDGLEQVLLWSQGNASSTVCSCLATHAAAKVFYDIDRQHLPSKCWGVFEHQVVAPSHQLMRNVLSKISMCHSRFNDVSADALVANDVEILISSEQAGVQCATDKNLGMLYFQGHPEYDDISLLKEYKREVVRFVYCQREDYPPLPIGYFVGEAKDIAEEFKLKVLGANQREDMLALFPENELQSKVQNSWRQPSQQVFTNWIEALLNS